MVPSETEAGWKASSSSSFSHPALGLLVRYLCFNPVILLAQHSERWPAPATCYLCCFFFHPTDIKTKEALSLHSRSQFHSHAEWGIRVQGGRWTLPRAKRRNWNLELGKRDCDKRDRVLVYRPRNWKNTRKWNDVEFSQCAFTKADAHLMFPL